MPTEADIYLTDEFVQFSETVKTIKDNKVRLQDEYRKTVDTIKINLKSLDEQAMAAKVKWDEFVRNFAPARPHSVTK